MKTPKTRADAQLLGAVFFNTGRPCIYGHRSNRYAASRRCVVCDEARRTMPAYKARAQARAKRNSRRHREQIVRKKYGTDLVALELVQNHKCAICKSPLTTGKQGCQVDHNHRTGAVRGLLCGPCNNGLGCLKDSPKLMLAAIKYLNRTYAREIQHTNDRVNLEREAGKVLKLAA